MATSVSNLPRATSVTSADLLVLWDAEAAAGSKLRAILMSDFLNAVGGTLSTGLTNGNNGYSPVWRIVEDGDRAVIEVVSWTGGNGAMPATGYIGTASELVEDIEDAADIRGLQGIQGDKGWSPVLTGVADGERRVLQVSDWQGGAGTKPATGKYVGAAGLVDAIGDALDIRGPAGAGDISRSGSITAGHLVVWLSNTSIADGGALTAATIPNVPAGSIAATSVQAALNELDTEKQPLDSDLTAIAALTTTSFGRSVLTQADASALRTLAGLILGTDVQAYDSDLAAIAALATTSFGRSVLTQADASALRTLAGLVIGTNVQAFDSDLASIAALTTTSYGRSFLELANAAAGLTLLGLVKAAGSDIQTGTDDAKFATAKAMRDAMAFSGLTDAGTIAVNMAAGFNFSVTIAGNRTLGAPTNAIAGQSGLILIIQDGTGSRTLSYASAWKFPGGAPTASTAAGTVDAIAYTVTTGGGSPIIRATYIKAFA